MDVGLWLAGEMDSQMPNNHFHSSSGGIRPLGG